MTKSTFIPTDEQYDLMQDHFSDVTDTCEAMLDDGFDKQYIKDMLISISKTL